MTPATKTNLEIDVTVSDPDWTTSFLDVEKLAGSGMKLTLRMAVLPKKILGRDIEASIVLANDDLIQILNREYRKKDAPTNVLTFASLDSNDPIPPNAPYPLGDVILSFQTIDREAREQGKFFKDHFLHMVVHGTLHLLGYDHETEDEANIMESLEIRILEKMNVQNPYMEKLPMA
ncbi:MAG TPA: rRNA maturation RNase YbeY [Micavibrio sp.]|nr:rRNA maturation RNase YbeY [Micavibrio sp.]